MDMNLIKTSRKNHTQGIYFDLTLIFNDLNKRFFNQSIVASLSWGRRKTLHGKRSLRLGSYHPVKKAILINPCLDQAIVPHICIERIMFHEMLHQYFPAKKSHTGKNLVHYREFYEFEKTYPYLEQADRWFAVNLKRLLTH
jgi:hypothetical protein